MADVIEAEAEVMGGSEELSVAYNPAVISANFDTLEAKVKELVKDYEGASYDLTDPGAVRDAKRHRTYLNGIAKQIDERRKAVKREYMRPYEEFDKRAREVAKIASDVADGIKAQVDEAEENRKANRYAELEQHYEEFAGLLAPVVPYERLHDPKWLNKTCRTAEAELDEKVEKLAADWESLKSAFEGTEYYDVAERELFNTLDLGKAIHAANTAKSEAERIAELRRAMEGTVAEEPVPEPETAPEPVPEPEQAPTEIVGETPVSEPEPSCGWVVEFTATRGQAQAVATFLKSLGLSGTIKVRR